MRDDNSDAPNASTLSMSAAVAIHLASAAQPCLSDGWSFGRWPKEITPLPRHVLPTDLSDFAKALVGIFRRYGYVRVDCFSSLFANYDEPVVATAATLTQTLLGSPLRIFRNYPSHWRILDVDPSRPPNRSRGVGEIPLHIDFVNASNPPDIVCMLGIREDPYGGGVSLLASMEDIEYQLSESDLEQLGKPHFRDGFVDALDGIGWDINPFPVIDVSDHWKYRFTEHLCYAPLAPLEYRAVRNLCLLLRDRAIHMTLPPGALLFVDQHRVLHGRTALRGDQNRLPGNERRLVLQSFVRCL